MKAIVNVAICPLQTKPTMQSELGDEALFGMVVDITEDINNEWCKINTHYRYDGYAPKTSLLFGDEQVEAWQALPKMFVLKNSCDILNEPKVQGWHIASINRGGVVSPIGEPNDDGWQEVALPDGQKGYTKCSFLGKYYEKPSFEEENSLREAVVQSAKTYEGAHYRWGGKSPQGIDCSGLVSMAYMLNGVLIYRDAQIKPDFPVKEITFEEAKKGDLLFFPGHVAMYLGDGEYIHSTARKGYDGVVYSSLNPEHEHYLEALADKITAVGSIF